MMIDEARTEGIISMTPASSQKKAGAALKAAGGEAITFESLLSHQEDVFRICLGFSRNYAEAEDLTQEIYLKAYRSLGTMKNPGVVKHWLFRIAKNACLDHQKTLRLRQTLLFRWAAKPTVDEAPDTLSINDLLTRLKAAVRSLPPKLRETFVLREYAHLSYANIALTLGIREGSVMSRLNRARAAVSRRLKEAPDEKK